VAAAAACLTELAELAERSPRFATSVSGPPRVGGRKSAICHLARRLLWTPAMTNAARAALILPFLLAACGDPGVSNDPSDAAPPDVREYSADCGVTCGPPPELQQQVPGAWALTVGTPEAPPACPPFDHPTSAVDFTATLDGSGNAMQLAVSGEGRSMHQSDQTSGILLPDGDVRVFFEIQDSSWGDHHDEPVTPVVFYDLLFHADDTISGEASTELSWPAAGEDPAQTCGYRMSLTGTRTPAK
jgi:hypothetical protein